eukprot:342090-Amphidinium_carterae.1
MALAFARSLWNRYESGSVERTRDEYVSHVSGQMETPEEEKDDIARALAVQEVSCRCEDVAMPVSSSTCDSTVGESITPAFNLLPSVGTWLMQRLPTPTTTEPFPSCLPARCAAPARRSTADLEPAKEVRKRITHCATRRTPTTVKAMRIWRQQRSLAKLASHEKSVQQTPQDKGIRPPDAG